MVFIVLFAMSWDTLEPTEFGLVQNGFTGYVDLRPSSVYEGGRYFVWLVRASKAKKNAQDFLSSLQYCTHASANFAFILSRAGPLHPPPHPPRVTTAAALLPRLPAQSAQLGL